MNQKVLAAVLLVVIALALTWLVMWRGRQGGASVENVLPTTPPPGFGSGGSGPPVAPGR